MKNTPGFGGHAAPNPGLIAREKLSCVMAKLSDHLWTLAPLTRQVNEQGAASHDLQ